MVRINANRISWIANVSGVWLVVRASGVLTALALLGFVYDVDRGVIVMFGMVVAAGISMLSDVTWNRRNMVIFAISLSVGLGLQLDPKAVQYLPDTWRILMTSGLLPAALISIVLNLILPAERQPAEHA